ncbi:hypothetical protein [Streptomyces scopuliridis]|uniref:hypothetical protein n=1 Tax=Streptomyces scopuliridis TaxID=452529 RepID=UPI0036C80458
MRLGMSPPLMRVLACRNDASISSIQSGDLLRVTGTVVQPDDPTAPARLTVDALEVLEAALLPAIGNCDY